MYHRVFLAQSFKTLITMLENRDDYFLTCVCLIVNVSLKIKVQLLTSWL